MRIADQRSYFVVTCTLSYGSFAEAMSAAPDDIAAHVQRSNALHAAGTLLMAGAFIDAGSGPLRTMGVAPSREAGEEYLHGDPFYIKGMITAWRIEEWANMFAS